jgi:hypothetical protein
MEDVVTRFVADLIGRLSGPLTLRLFLQPAVATLLAVRDGVKDAQEGRYQVLVFRWLYPVEAMVTAVILAIVPYVLLRGVVNRVARTWISQREVS